MTTVLWYLYWYLPGALSDQSGPEWLSHQVQIQVGDLILYCLVFLLGILCNSFLREKRPQYWRLNKFFTREWPVRADDDL